MARPTGKGWSLRLRGARDIGQRLEPSLTRGRAIGAKAGAFADKDFDEDEMGGFAKIYGACSCPSGE
jgi:hypothetical protein